MAKVTGMLRSKLTYFASCFGPRHVLQVMYGHQAKTIDQANISAYLQTLQDDLLICEERGILEQPLIALAHEDPRKMAAFIKGFMALSETELIQDNDDPFFIRFYSHLLLTLSRNIMANSDQIRQELTDCLDLQVRTTEQTTYQALKQSLSDSKDMRKCFNRGFVLLAQKLIQSLCKSKDRRDSEPEESLSLSRVLK